MINRHFSLVSPMQPFNSQTTTKTPMIVINFVWKRSTKYQTPLSNLVWVLFEFDEILVRKIILLLTTKCHPMWESCLKKNFYASYSFCLERVHQISDSFIKFGQGSFWNCKILVRKNLILLTAKWHPKCEHFLDDQVKPMLMFLYHWLGQILLSVL